EKSITKAKIRKDYELTMKRKRNTQRKVPCPYCGTNRHNKFMCLRIGRLDENCATLFETLNEEEMTKVQTLINQAFGDDYIDDTQLPQALELLIEILEDFKDNKNDKDEKENLTSSNSYDEKEPLGSNNLGCEGEKADLN
ncbi:16358_t:CDS:2, partial [Gigaspora rosea]